MSEKEGAVIIGVDIPLSDLIGVLLKFYVASCISAFIIGVIVLGAAGLVLGSLYVFGVRLPYLP